MKKTLGIISLFFISVHLFAQAPQKMSYQAVIRNSSQVLVGSTAIGMRISIVQGTSNGTAVYIEKQNVVSNVNALVSLQIGAGTIVSGNFAAIDWGAGPYFIKTETDPTGGTNYTISGTSELMSVPYALFSANGSGGAMGPTGPTGSQGAKGNQGLTGANGAQGAQGSTGSQGESGAIGASGEDGKNGEIGATGLQGAKGNQGSVGQTGATGISGIQGKAGITGAAGNDGTIGARGIQGLPGVNGTNGTDGLKGDIGITGAYGATGITGANGADGSNGINGTNGIKGDVGLTGAIGAKGFTGNNGVDGINGTNGIKGDTGLTGAVGARGLTGTNGTNGLNGSDGIKGDIGLTGLTGLQGLTGTNGTNGTNGIKGDIGLTGAAGAIGFTGTNGTNGTDGANGINGLKGDIGLTGLTGSHGLTGTNGTDGANGTNGIKGDIGLTGLAGTNGVNGADGANGTNGLKGDTGVTGLTGATGSFSGSFSGDVTGTQNATIVSKINGVPLATLSTGILKNTTASGVPSIAVAADFPLLNQNTSGTASNITGIILPVNGGTGVANNNAASLTWPAPFATTIITTGATAITLPLTGTLATTDFVLANSDRYSSVTAGAEVSTVSTTDDTIMGMVLTPPAGKYAVSFNGQYSITPGDRTGQGKIDLRTAYNLLMAKTVTNSSHTAVYGGGETLTPGVYFNAGACTSLGTLILDGQNDPNAEFIFKFGAAFSTAAGTTVLLTNGASACNIYWIAEGAVALGASTVMKGNILSNNGAVTLGNQSSVTGRLFSNNGAVGLDVSTISMPSACNPLFGSLSGFAIFSSAGNVSNAGGSNVTGDIGTNLGTITGFEAAAVTGTIYPPSIVASSATATFSIYQNGNLVPFSDRTRISTMNLAEVSLQAVATVAPGQSIDIRWKIDAGTVKLQNRILTLISVR